MTKIGQGFWEGTGRENVNVDMRYAAKDLSYAVERVHLSGFDPDVHSEGFNLSQSCHRFHVV